MKLRDLEHRMTVVAEALRDAFPDDFYQRCSYAALGLLALLRDAGETAEAVGGDFVAFILSQDGKNPSMKGFASGEASGSHFWLQTPDRLIDLGPHFLPADTNYPIAPMPAVAWDVSTALPNYLRYRMLSRFPYGQEMEGDGVVQTKARAFAAICRERLAQQTGHRSFPTWIVTGAPSVTIAANNGNRWAIGAAKFETWADATKLPF